MLYTKPDQDEVGAPSSPAFHDHPPPQFPLVKACKGIGKGRAASKGGFCFLMISSSHFTNFSSGIPRKSLSYWGSATE